MMSNHQSLKQELRAISAGHIASNVRESCARCTQSEIKYETRLYCSRNKIQVNKMDICTFFVPLAHVQLKRIVSIKATGSAEA